MHGCVTDAHDSNTQQALSVTLQCAAAVWVTASNGMAADDGDFYADTAAPHSDFSVPVLVRDFAVQAARVDSPACLCYAVAVLLWLVVPSVCWLLAQRRSQRQATQGVAGAVCASTPPPPAGALTNPEPCSTDAPGAGESKASDHCDNSGVAATDVAPTDEAPSAAAGVTTAAATRDGTFASKVAGVAAVSLATAVTGLCWYWGLLPHLPAAAWVACKILTHAVIPGPHYAVRVVFKYTCLTVVAAPTVLLLWGYVWRALGPSWRAQVTAFQAHARTVRGNVALLASRLGRGLAVAAVATASCVASVYVLRPHHLAQAASALRMAAAVMWAVLIHAPTRDGPGSYWPRVAFRVLVCVLALAPAVVAGVLVARRSPWAVAVLKRGAASARHIVWACVLGLACCVASVAVGTVAVVCCPRLPPVAALVSVVAVTALAGIVPRAIALVVVPTSLSLACVLVFVLLGLVPAPVVPHNLVLAALVLGGVALQGVSTCAFLAAWRAVVRAIRASDPPSQPGAAKSGPVAAPDARAGGDPPCLGSPPDAAPSAAAVAAGDDIGGEPAANPDAVVPADAASSVPAAATSDDGTAPHVYSHGSHDGDDGDSGSRGGTASDGDDTGRQQPAHDVPASPPSEVVTPPASPATPPSSPEQVLRPVVEVDLRTIGVEGRASGATTPTSATPPRLGASPCATAPAPAATAVPTPQAVESPWFSPSSPQAFAHPTTLPPAVTPSPQQRGGDGPEPAPSSPWNFSPLHLPPPAVASTRGGASDERKVVGGDEDTPGDAHVVDAAADSDAHGGPQIVTDSPPGHDVASASTSRGAGVQASTASDPSPAALRSATGNTATATRRVRHPSSAPGLGVRKSPPKRQPTVPAASSAAARRRTTRAATSTGGAAAGAGRPSGRVSHPRIPATRPSPARRHNTGGSGVRGAASRPVAAPAATDTATDSPRTPPRAAAQTRGARVRATTADGVPSPGAGALVTPPRHASPSQSSATTTPPWSASSSRSAARTPAQNMALSMALARCNAAMYLSPGGANGGPRSQASQRRRHQKGSPQRRHGSPYYTPASPPTRGSMGLHDRASARER